MKLNWARIARTAVQSASGAGLALITAVSAKEDGKDESNA